jgi:hypothetical protein
MKARTFVRIRCSSHSDAEELALRLQADGYRVTRRWKIVITRTDSPEDAASLTKKLHLETLPSGDLAATRSSPRAATSGSA